jgi:hypothetical protein
MNSAARWSAAASSAEAGGRQQKRGAPPVGNAPRAQLPESPVLPHQRLGRFREPSPLAFLPMAVGFASPSDAFVVASLNRGT